MIDYRVTTPDLITEWYILLGLNGKWINDRMLLFCSIFWVAAVQFLNAQDSSDEGKKIVLLIFAIFLIKL